MSEPLAPSVSTPGSTPPTGRPPVAGPPAAAGATPAGIETAIARILAGGTRLAIAALAVGSLLMVVAGVEPLSTTWPALHLATLPADLLALRPEAFLWLGLILVIATPLLRVGAATLGFARTGERRMVALGVGVLVVIALAVAAGVMGA